MWLAIDTSSSRASLAWVDPASPHNPPDWVCHVEAGRSHNTLLFTLLADALQQPCAARLTAVIVGTGPGSYTGTRIGIAAAIGIALQRPGTAVYPWPSCTALLPVNSDPGTDAAESYLWLSDARRSRFALTEVRQRQMIHAAQLFTQSEALTQCRRYLELKLPLCTSDDDPTALTGKLGLAPGQIHASRPEAALLATQVAALSPAERSQLAAQTPNPIYLAAPYVTTPKTR